ncbi:hypothetical protein JOB18_043299 [Solea senegalensis]|uniref:Uncharacterized protein n=1 Tax=Solea senegalensis TaxID=28829 RepID=A0AAV6RMR9_SOLSE|nr:hypothetical protein JOB18_043299 [Solea senegalensis]
MGSGEPVCQLLRPAVDRSTVKLEVNHNNMHQQQKIGQLDKNNWFKEKLFHDGQSGWL